MAFHLCACNEIVIHSEMKCCVESHRQNAETWAAVWILICSFIKARKWSVSEYNTILKLSFIVLKNWAFIDQTHDERNEFLEFEIIEIEAINRLWLWLWFVYWICSNAVLANHAKMSVFACEYFFLLCDWQALQTLWTKQLGI